MFWLISEKGLKAFIFALSFFFLLTSNVFAYYQSPIDYDDNYIRFGDSENPNFEANGITLFVDESSISAQWINLTFQLDSSDMIAERSIDKFYVLANGKIVEEVMVQFVDDEWTGETVPSSWYLVKPSIPELIGTYVYFQIVAVEEVSENLHYAVAWSPQSSTYRMDPLPVNDAEAIGVLEAIYSKLSELKTMLESKLDNLAKEIEKLWKPTEETKSRFDQSVQSFMEKTPMTQTFLKISDMTESLQQSMNQVQSPAQIGDTLTLGGTFEFILGVPESRVHLLDLTPFIDQVILFRKIMVATFWVYFFHMIVNYITPKPRL